MKKMELIFVRTFGEEVLYTYFDAKKMQNHIHVAFKDIALLCDSNEFQSEKV